MFKPGERAVILASSVPKDKTGIKRGSTGYVSQSNIHSVERRYDTTLVLVRLHIVFNRFGYEKSMRCEEKEVFALYNISRKSTSDQFKRTENLIKAIDNGKVNSLLSSHMVGGMPSSAVVCVIGKSSNNIDLLDHNNIEETICWLDSIFKNESRWESNIFHNYINVPRVKRPKNVNSNIVHTLVQIAYNRDDRRRYYGILRKEKSENLARTIAIIRQIHTIALKRTDSMFMEKIGSHFINSPLEGNSTDAILHSEVFGQLVDCCDSPYMYLALVDAIRKNLFLNRYQLFELVTENIKLAPQHITAMAETVEFENNKK